MGATRDVALNELPFRGLSINSTGAGATVNIVASDSGVIFINKYVAGDCTYNLPSVADGKGKMFWFFQAQNSMNMIIAAPANTMFMADDLAATTANDKGTAIECGDSAMVIGDGTSYYFFEIYGAWDNA